MSTRGAALPLAVLALLVMAVLAATSLLLGRQEMALGVSTLRLQSALAAAEGGMELQLALWDRPTLNALAAGDSVAFGGSLAAGGWYRGATRRLSESLFLVRSEGFSRDSAARQELALLVRLEPVEISRAAALRTRGAVAVRDLALVDGTDGIPPTASDCAPPEAAVAGVQVPDSTVSSAGCAGAACVRGSPAVLVDPSLDSAVTSTFGGAAFDALRSRATIILPGGIRTVGPSLLGGACNPVDPDNWGSPTDPSGPCAGRFPMVWSDGDLVLTGGEGQGVLLVDGDLSLGGGVTFHGVVIVRGRILSTGPGGSIYGSVVAVNAGGAQHDIGGNTLIRYSSCALDRALLSSAPPGRLRSRSWIQLQ